MSFQFQRNPVHMRPVLWVALMLTIALSSFGVTTASASCGDYLNPTIHNLDADSVGDFRSGSEPLRPAIPCTGLACQNAPAIPDMPTSVDVRFTFIERLAVESGPMMSLLEVGEQQIIGNDAPFLPEGYRAGLERPPRFA